jgi:Fe-S-cluster containining protein
MADRILHIAENQNYGCIQCGRCCRRFHVLMSEDEVRRITRLLASRPNNLPKDFVTRIDGKPYFSRKPSGGCVFLDEETGYCRMHSLFGFRQKALTCRGYPVNISSTFPGEASAIARMDCPAVQRNAGKPLTAQRSDIKGLASELGLKLAFTKRELEGMDRESVERMVGVLVGLAEAPSLSAGAKAWAFHDLVVRLEKVKPFANDRNALAEMLPTLVEKAIAGVPKGSRKGLGWFSRAVFRAWLGACLRRDTELVNPGIGQRVLRAWTMLRVTLGFGSLRPLGWEHPDSSLARCGVFGARQGASDGDVWDAYWRFLVSRLQAFQFFGVSYYDRPFFVGLKALALTYPLVLASARHHSRSRGAERIEAVDVHYGIGAIDHTHGRSPLLQFDMWRTIEDFFLARWDRLQASLGWE